MFGYQLVHTSFRDSYGTRINRHLTIYSCIRLHSKIFLTLIPKLEASRDTYAWGVPFEHALPPPRPIFIWSQKQGMVASVFDTKINQMTLFNHRWAFYSFLWNTKCQNTENILFQFLLQIYWFNIRGKNRTGQSILPSYKKIPEKDPKEQVKAWLLIIWFLWSCRFLTIIRY